MVLRKFLFVLNPYNFIAFYAMFFIIRVHGQSVNSGVEKEILVEKMLQRKEILPTLVNNFADGGSEVFDEVHKVLRQDYSDESTEELTCENSPSFLFEVSKKVEDNDSGNLFSILPPPFSVSDSIGNEMCKTQMKKYARELRKYKLWALKMYDSTGKVQAGILQGNMHHFGDFDQCLGIKEEFEEYTIHGKYCLASLDITAMSSVKEGRMSLQQALYLAHGKTFVKSTIDDAAHFIPRWTTTSFGFCVPASCTSQDIEVSLRNVLEDYNVTSGLMFHTSVEEDMCYIQKTTSYHPAMYFFIAVFLVAVLATLTDNNTKSSGKSKWVRILQAFSFKRTITDLVSTSSEPDDIHCIHGIRSLLTVALYLSHKLLASGIVPYTNRIYFTQRSNDAWTMVFRSSLVYTDSFLLISGVLTSYNMSKEMERKQCINWKKRYIARFLRLTPALLALVVFYAYLWENLGTGPLWNQVVKYNADLCKKHMWRNLLYIQNLYPLQEMCATHSHQLALDMQLFLVSPLLVYLLYTCSSIGIVVLLVAALGSAVLRYLTVFSHNLTLVIYHGASVSQLYKTANLTYTLATHRATSYVFGVGLGYAFKRKMFQKVSKIIVTCGWILTIYLSYLCIFSMSDMTSTRYEYNSEESALYASWSPIGWSVALSWLIFCCHNGYGGFVNSFLCWKSLALLSKISYAIYLTQFVVFFYNVGTVRAPQYFNISNIVNVGEFFVVISVSVVTTLLFDLPMQEVKNILMESEPRTKVKK